MIVGVGRRPGQSGVHVCGEWCGLCPTGAIFEVMPRERFAPEKILHRTGTVRSVCPYCGVGCQVDLHVAGYHVMRVTSPDIELDTPTRAPPA